jgi:hypothetical protein
MGSLIFSCPKTWRVIEAGIEMDDATLAEVTVPHSQCCLCTLPWNTRAPN